MTDILDRLRAYSSRWHPEDAVDLAAEAADEIERLRAADAELSILRSKLRGTLSTAHDCTDRTDCAMRKIVWHLRAIL